MDRPTRWRNPVRALAHPQAPHGADAAQADGALHRLLEAVPAQAAGARREAQQVLDHHVAVEGRVPRQVADAAAHLQGVAGGVVPGDGDASRGGQQVGGQHLQHRRLAGAVGPHEADDLPPLDAEGDVVHGGDGAGARPEDAGDRLHRGIFFPLYRASGWRTRKVFFFFFLIFCTHP